MYMMYVCIHTYIHTSCVQTIQCFGPPCRYAVSSVALSFVGMASVNPREYQVSQEFLLPF